MLIFDIQVINLQYLVQEWKLPEELVEQLAKSRFEQRESILFNYVLFALWRI